MSPPRENAPITGGASQIILAKGQAQTTAECRAAALALDTAAVAEGLWPPSAEILDALSHLADAIVWDLATLEMAS